ncbi:PEP-CTERM sorting domain-containing protein [Luteithermobacter gelatinilyticus]|uniref:PEP-CTERM sorting domain-containing protein n=1 Tax=Luteithermobacter gelatinilyticus TaxID=2582913 RepID=UPI00143D1C69|nr:PEP-CTERM sorting domain-containing protein [Luteithermobacter gelatinilyticus]
MKQILHNMAGGRKVLLAAAAIVAPLMASPAQAALISWADWTASTSTTVDGTLTVGSTNVNVDVSSSSNFHFVTTGTGTNFWTEGSPAPYTGNTLVDNAPPASDIIALGAGGTITVTFDQAVEDLIVALVSWNGNVVNFSDPIEIIGEGRGFWGDGAFSAVTSTGFTGSGELHGVVRLPGEFTSFSFTHTSEFWHGFTIGVAGLADPEPDPNTIPEPAALALFGMSLIGLGVGLGRARRRQKSA